MRRWCRFAAIGVLAGTILAVGSGPGMAESRAHVYLLRGLMNIFSLGMDTLCEELNRRGVYSTVHNHSEWQGLANHAAAEYKAGKEGPIILIGHSLGADAVMEMAAYLGRMGVPVALVIPFDGTASYAASSNVSRVVNLTQRDYAYMRRGPGFKGTLANVDVSSDGSIDHINIDKSPRLHVRAINEVLAVTGGHRIATPGGSKTTPGSAPAANGGEAGPKATPASGEAAKPASAPTAAPAAPAASPTAPVAPAAPAKSSDGGMRSTGSLKPVADSGTPVIAMPESRPAPASAETAAPPPPRKPAAAPPLQMPD